MTKVHDKNKSQFGQVLDQMETQVSQLKKTVVDLRSREFSFGILALTPVLTEKTVD